MSYFASLSVAEVATRTVDAFQAMVEEAPSATSIDELSDVFLRGDRKIYSGIMLGILTVVLIMFAS